MNTTQRFNHHLVEIMLLSNTRTVLLSSKCMLKNKHRSYDVIHVTLLCNTMYVSTHLLLLFHIYRRGFLSKLRLQQHHRQWSMVTQQAELWKEREKDVNLYLQQDVSSSLDATPLNWCKNFSIRWTKERTKCSSIVDPQRVIVGSYWHLHSCCM